MTTTTAYEKATTYEKDAQGVWRGSVDPSWYTGRGAFGGLVAASILRAMTEDLHDPACHPRSLTVHFAAPPTGAIAITTELVRAGKSVKHMAARYASEGEVACFATASFGRDRKEPASFQQDAMPTYPGPEGLTPIPEELPGFPPFLANFDIRYCSTALPGSGAAIAAFAAWVRLRDPVPIDASVLSMLLDILPPAVSATFTTWRPVASVDFTVQLFAHAPFDLDPERHLLVTIRSRWAGDGYAEEMRDLWTADGRLLGQCRQVIAII